MSLVSENTIYSWWDHWIAHSWSFSMTPRAWNYVYPELSYDHFSDANETIFQKLKMEKIMIISSIKYKNLTENKIRYF